MSFLLLMLQVDLLHRNCTPLQLCGSAHKLILDLFCRLDSCQQVYVLLPNRSKPANFLQSFPQAIYFIKSIVMRPANPHHAARIFNA